MSDDPVNRWSGVIPIMMSMTALMAVAKAHANFAHYGPPLDEDGPWHVFMLMISLQLPIIAYCILSSRHEFKRALPVLATQLSLWAVSFGAAYYVPGIH